MINTVDIIADSLPYYIDTSAVSICQEFPDGLCPPDCWVPYNIHYKIQAVDITDKVSCLSDFVPTVAVKLVNSGGGGSEEPYGDNFALHNVQSTGLDKFSLAQNYPNPFNPVTTISFNIPKLSLVKVAVYDILGREVAVLVDEIRSPGIYSVRFDGSSLASGIYYCKLITNEVNFTKKMLLIK